MRNDTILVGKGGSVEFVPPHALVNDMHLILSHLVYDHMTTTQQLVDAMACAASILKGLGGPLMVVKNPTEMPDG